MGVWILRHRRAKRLARAHGMLAGCQPKGEDVMHLVVVLHGCIEELRVFGAVLIKKYTMIPTSYQFIVFNTMIQP